MSQEVATEARGSSASLMLPHLTTSHLRPAGALRRGLTPPKPIPSPLQGLRDHPHYLPFSVSLILTLGVVNQASPGLVTNRKPRFRPEQLCGGTSSAPSGSHQPGKVFRAVVASLWHTCHRQHSEPALLAHSYSTYSGEL